MAYLGTQYAITTSAAKLTTILGLSRPVYPVFISIRNKTGNTGIVYLGPSTVTNVPANAREQIVAGNRWEYAAGNGTRNINTDEIYLVGSNATDQVYITVVE